jgi:competence protein ComFC
MLIKKIKSKIFHLLNFLFSIELCICCYKKSNEIVCTNCLDQFKKTIPIKFYFLENKIYIYSLTSYEGKIKKILHSKYYKNENPYFFFGEKMADYFLKYNLKADYIIPIPQHFIKKCIRQFNQSETLAKKISKNTNIPLINAINVKKYYKPQNKIKIEDRTENIKNVFIKSKNIENLNNKTLCIVDDIYTTGSTIKEAIKTLKIKNSNIIILVIARCSKINN